MYRFSVFYQIYYALSVSSSNDYSNRCQNDSKGKKLKNDDCTRVSEGTGKSEWTNEGESDNQSVEKKHCQTNNCQ